MLIRGLVCLPAKKTFPPVRKRFITSKFIQMKKLKNKIELFVETTENGTVAYSMIYPISATGKTNQELMDNALVNARRYFEIYGIRISWQDIQMRIDLDRPTNKNLFVNTRLIAGQITKNQAVLS